jgi:hypothetical protein
MAEPYFFDFVDINNQQITEPINGTWSLYCSENGRDIPFNDGLVLIEDKQNFTTNEENGVSVNGGEPFTVDENYVRFYIIVEVDGYKLSYTSELIGGKDEPNGSIPTTSSLSITLITEEEYIANKAQSLQDELLKRFEA